MSAEKSELMLRLIAYIGDRGFATGQELRELVKREMEDAHDILRDHGIVLSDTGISATPAHALNGQYTLSKFGRELYEKKQNAPYAEMLDADPSIGRKAIEAGMSANQAAGELTEHDPERAKALLKKIMGEELYRGVRLMQYKPLYPIFLLDGVEMVFVQGAMPETDHFLIDGIVVVRDMASLGDAIGEYFTDPDDEEIWPDDEEDGDDDAEDD